MAAARGRRIGTIAIVALGLLGCQRPEPTAPAYAPALPSPQGAPAQGALQLPPAGSDAGVLVRMLLAECKGPGYPDYDETEAWTAMHAMKAVVHNRLFSDPARFGAAGARTYADIICAPGQWAGFRRGADGRWLVDPDIMQRVDELVARANQGAPGAYHRFVRHALEVTYGPPRDPFAGLRAAGGVPVRPGAYGFRRAGSGHPGGAFVPIAPSEGGVLAGTQFYAWPWR